jgi:16S rRNA (guanine(966)-N(2))-methyltransferase RsmD
MRIMAGEFKNRELLSPPESGPTRPISASIKKSLFGMLGEDLSGTIVADLYCGTGTLGIESLSRGAKRCCFADRDGRVLSLLRKNLQALGVMNRATIWAGDISAKLPRWVEGLSEPFDIVFVDPPYETARKWSWPEVTAQIFSPLASCLAESGVVVLRLPGKTPMPETLGDLSMQRWREYGDMTLAFLGRTKT